MRCRVGDSRAANHDSSALSFLSRSCIVSAPAARYLTPPIPQGLQERLRYLHIFNDVSLRLLRLPTGHFPSSSHQFTGRQRLGKMSTDLESGLVSVSGGSKNMKEADLMNLSWALCWQQLHKSQRPQTETSLLRKLVVPNRGCN